MNLIQNESQLNSKAIGNVIRKELLAHHLSLGDRRSVQCCIQEQKACEPSLHVQLILEIQFKTKSTEGMESIVQFESKIHSSTEYD